MFEKIIWITNQNFFQVKNYKSKKEFDLFTFYIIKNSDFEKINHSKIESQVF